MAQDITGKTTRMGAQPQNLEEQIQQRAFELYETRGREDGHDVEDWLHAEAEIKKMREIPIAA